jgi:hypothetical protein
MITLDLERMYEIKGIDRPYAFFTSHGFSPHVAHNLVSGAYKSLQYGHLEKLCRIFQCLPHDLLNYKPTTRGLPPAMDHLLVLRKPPLKTKSLKSLLASLPPDQVLRVTEQLQASLIPEPVNP